MTAPTPTTHRCQSCEAQIPLARLWCDTCLDAYGRHPLRESFAVARVHVEPPAPERVLGDSFGEIVGGGT